MTVVLPGELGKPRPALLVQSDRFGPTTPTVSVLPITGTYADAPLLRIEVAPSGQNGLIKQSYLQVDKATSIPRGKIGPVIGCLENANLLAVNRALIVFLGLA